MARHTFLQSRRHTVRMVERIGSGVSFAAGPMHAFVSGRDPEATLEVAVAARALYLTDLSLYGERPCLAHAAINSCRGLGDSTEPHPKVTPPYALGSTTTPAPHNGHSAFGERTERFLFALRDPHDGDST